MPPGRPPALTAKLIDAPVELQVPESDAPRDVAVLADVTGGGPIVYGLSDDQKHASGRVGVACDEGLERTLRQVAAGRPAPWLLDLGIAELGEPGVVCRGRGPSRTEHTRDTVTRAS